MLEVLLRGHVLHVGLARFHRRLHRLEICAVLLELLLAHHLSLEEILFARVIQLGDVQVGAGLGEIRARLGELRIDIRRVNFREHVALRHLRADILVPRLHVAAGPREDGGLAVRP